MPAKWGTRTALPYASMWNASLAAISRMKLLPRLRRKSAVLEAFGMLPGLSRPLMTGYRAKKDLDEGEIRPLVQGFPDPISGWFSWGIARPA